MPSVLAKVMLRDKIAVGSITQFIVFEVSVVYEQSYKT